MLISNTELRFVSDGVGYGVFTKSLIPKGTLVWVKDELDIVVTQEQKEQLGENYNKVFKHFEFRNRNGEYLLLWDAAKHINHSFKANCIVTTYNFFIAVFDILPGEQITIDYGTLNINEPFSLIDDNNELDTVLPDDIKLYHQIWDKRVGDAIKKFNKVEQELYCYLSDSVKQELELVCLGVQKMPSILNCYYEKKRETIK